MSSITGDSQPPPPDPEDRPAVPRDLCGRGERVVCVDDDPAVLFVVERLLSRIGYRLTSFSDPRDALAQLRREPRQVDLLITDLAMPGADGIELAAEVQRMRPEMPVILLSGFVEERTPHEIRQAGIRAILPKPVSLPELAATLRRLL